MVKKRSVAIIPARGGSKRIPKKNITPFAGLPLIAHTIIAARESQCFDSIIVSTDSEEIKAVAVRFGAEVPFLRDAYADDAATSSQATEHCLQQLLSIGLEYSLVTQLMPNCPLRDSSDIQAAHKNFHDMSAKAQISCSSFSWTNPWWAATLDEHSRPQYLFKDALSKTSQSLAELVCPTGAIWISETSYFLRNKTFYSDETIFFQMPWEHAIDIDTVADLALAEKLYE